MRIREVPAMTAALALGLASAAHAGNELYLRWDDCLGDGGTYNKTFACDVNAGAQTLVGSFRLAATTESVSGFTVIINLTALGPTLPAWWDLRSVVGACRRGSMVASFTAPPTSTGCADPWTSQGVAGGFAYDYPDLYPERGRIRMQWAVPAGNQFDVPGDQEHFAFQLRIDRRFTTGASTCNGCATPVCIGWTEAQVTRAPQLPWLHIVGWETPDNGSIVTWQPGAVASMAGYCPPNRYCITEMVCESVTPARVPTWGAIKALYR